MITLLAPPVRVSGAVVLGVGLLAAPAVASTPDAKIVDFRLGAEGPEDLFGTTAARAGDVNGDGVADVLVGAPGVDQGGGEYSGRVYLFLGPLDGSRAASDADAIFTSEGVNDNPGFSIAAGDLNDDGLDDMIIGARSNDGAGIQAGRAYVFFGPVTGKRRVARADLKISGKEFDEAGSAVAAGDLNGDGVDDLNGDGVDDLVVGTTGPARCSAPARPISQSERTSCSAVTWSAGRTSSTAARGRSPSGWLTGGGRP